MKRARAVLAASSLAVVGALAGCSSADPAAVAAVGTDSEGYFAVVMMCDQGRTFIRSRFEAVDGTGPAVSWIGRTVEPITFYRLDGDPPDNWLIDVDGGLRSGVPYTFAAYDDEDFAITGPQFTLDELDALGAGEVIAADGSVFETNGFLDQGCTG